MCSTRILFLLVIGIFILQMIQIMIFIRQLMILLLSSICSLLMICYHLMIRNTYRVIWATSAHITSISCIKFVTQCHRLRSSCWWHSGKLATKLRQQRLDRPPLLMRRLQSNLNAAAWLIFNLHRSNHVSDALISLHWLRVPERIRSKVTVLVYKVLHGCALSYLGPFTYVGNLPSRRGIRSSCSDCLVQPLVHHSIVGSRAFSVAGPHCLPSEVTTALSLATFRTRLKTSLFTESYPGIRQIWHFVSTHCL